MVKGNDEKVDTSRRKFFKKAALATGGVAAAGVGATGVTKVLSATSQCVADIGVGYESDNHRQDRLLSQKKLVLMSDEEKKSMLDELIRHHHSEIA